MVGKEGQRVARVLDVRDHALHPGRHPGHARSTCDGSTAPAAQAQFAQYAASVARLLPSFDLGCWARYQLGGGAATLHYQTYHVELLRRIAATHPEAIWRRTYLRWRRCLPRTRHL